MNAFVLLQELDAGDLDGFKEGARLPAEVLKLPKYMLLADFQKRPGLTLVHVKAQLHKAQQTVWHRLCN